MKIIDDYTEITPIHPEKDPSDNTIALVGYLDSETPVYQDRTLKDLNEMFDPNSFKGPQGSGYLDASIESNTGFLADTGKLFGEYYGFDQKTMTQLVGGYPLDKFTGIQDATLLKDVRIVEYKGTKIYFPTAEMLVAYHVNLKALSIEQNATLGVLYTPYVKNETVATSIESLITHVTSDEFIDKYSREAKLVSQLVIDGLDGKLGRKLVA